ncbi:SDR family NAD(P)-dependent oxidoreductase [Pedobacter agri]|uniref:SDR family NAD(P)-dependent oxidoreductase n=1 Tax=Pedobacter agri TaxID=454586 RepID=UPI00374359D2
MFHSNGWRVIATMRSPENEEELTQLENVVLLPLDVTDFVQIQSTVAEALSTGEVDVVFNNAGYGLNGALESLEDEQIIRQINTNLLGAIRVTKAFVPSFRVRGAGLFINCTSIGGICTFPLSSIYHATKWALEGYSESMSFELSHFNIGIKTVAPGGIKTDFMGRSLEVGMSEPYLKFGNALSAAFQAGIEGASTPEQIAEVVYQAATDGKDQLRYVAGQDAQALYSRRLEIGNEAFRREIGNIFM